MTEAAAVTHRDSPAAPSSMERLRTYLAGLPDPTKRLLATEIQRAKARGEEIPGADMIIAALGIAARAPESEPAPAIGEEERDGVAARLLFRPLEPFLIDERVAVKTRGRIMRASLPAVWTYFRRDLKPAEAAELEKACAAALAGGDEPKALALAAAFLRLVSAAAYAAVEQTAGHDVERKRLALNLGGDRVLDDMMDALAILNDLPIVNAAVAKAPLSVKSLADESLANAKLMLDPVAASRPALLPYCLALLQGRLHHRAHLARLAIAAAESDDPNKIAATPYRAAVDLVICDIERATWRVLQALKAGRADRAASGVKDFHDTVRSLRTDMSLSGDGPWQRRIAKLRADLAAMLAAEIEGVPGEVRRLLRPRQRTDLPPVPLEAEVVAGIEARLDLLNHCRAYASEIALNEVTLRIFSEIQGYLDPTLTQLLENIRNAPDVDRALKISQIEAAVRFSARIFGASYAQLLQKAADVAINAGRAAGR